MGIRSIVAVMVGRFTAICLRIVGRRGTSLPGLVATRISGALLGDLLRQLQTCVVVTGTNGKTTTCALLYSMLRESGEDWISNQGGANLAQGVLATLLAHSDWRGRLRFKKAVLEVDEATLPRLVARFRPTLILVTNVLRDQLDRYGEIDQTLELLKQSVADSTVMLLTNADDPLAASLGFNRELTYFYGMENAPEDGTLRNEVRDGAFCLLCGCELQYLRFIYGQMGYYRCEKGHFSRPTPHYAGFVESEPHETHGAAALHVRELVRVDYWSEPFSVDAPVLGLYNLYNVLAAVSAARVLGYSPRHIVEGVHGYQAPLGRMQLFPGEPNRTLALIKNPTGANSVLRALEAEAQEKIICFAINDADADGRDVSWLWDIDLESFVPQARCRQWYCAGTRGLDMAVRLAYAGVSRESICVIPHLQDVLSYTGQHGIEAYVLSTYTALHPLADHFSANLKDAHNKGEAR